MRRTMRGAVILAAVALSTSLVPACRGETMQQLTVAVDIPAPDSICDDPEGIDLEGLSVSVTDQRGEELARASLGSGAPPTGWVPPATKVRLCRFPVTVELLDRPTYRVTVDGGGAVEFARGDLERTGWVAVYPAGEIPALAPAG